MSWAEVESTMSGFTSADVAKKNAARDGFCEKIDTRAGRDKRERAIYMNVLTG